MSFCTYDRPAVYDEERVRARKPHECCETGRVIRPGEFYWRCEMLFDGAWDRYCQCEDAYRFARKVNGVEPYDPERSDNCVPFGGVREYVREILDDDDPLKVEWAAIMAGDDTHERRRDAGKD